MLELRPSVFDDDTERLRPSMTEFATRNPLKTNVKLRLLLGRFKIC